MNTKDEKIKQAKKMVEIFVDEFCRDCEVCDDKDCMLNKLIKGETNIYGSVVIDLKEAE